MLQHSRNETRLTIRRLSLHSKWKEVYKVKKKEYIKPDAECIAVKKLVTLLAGSPVLEFTKEGDDDYADPELEVL